MSTTPALDWGDLTPAERAAMRLDHAAVLDRCRAVAGSPIDPVSAAAYERREATAELAETDEDAAIARGHRSPR